MKVKKVACLERKEECAGLHAYVSNNKQKKGKVRGRKRGGYFDKSEPTACSKQRKGKIAVTCHVVLLVAWIVKVADAR